MSASTTTTADPSAILDTPDVRPKTQWGKIIVSSVLGGVVAVVLAPTIAASAPVGVGWLIASNMTAGVVGSVTTKIASNAIGANVTEIEYNPYRARLRFRKAIVDHFDAYLDPVIDCIRSNSPGTFDQETRLALNGSLVFLKSILEASGHENSHVYLRYGYEVVPREGSRPRSIEEGVAAPELPVYHESAVAKLQLNETDSILDRVGGAVARGALFGGGIGLLGQALGQTGPLFERMFVLDTSPGINMVFTAESASAAADPLCNLIPGPSSEEKAAYLIELIAEIQCHINRVSQCAMSNGVGLIYKVELGIHSDVATTAGGATGSNKYAVWNQWESKVGM